MKKRYQIGSRDFIETMRAELSDPKHLSEINERLEGYRREIDGHAALADIQYLLGQLERADALLTCLLETR